jgi:hypothetical protein
LNKSFRQQYDPGVDSASNRNEYQGYLLKRGRGTKAVGEWGLTSFSTSCSDFIEILEVSNSWSPKGQYRSVKRWLSLLLLPLRKA